MNKGSFLTAVTMTLAMTLLARPAAAQYVRADYTGSVTNIYDGAPAWLTVGTPVYFEATFNPATLVDNTATADAVLASFGLDPTLLPETVGNVSLSADPRASLVIKFGPETFSKFNEVQYGFPYGDTPFDLGIGNLPAVDYIDGAFAGLSNTFISADGVGIDADPFNGLFGGFDGHSFGIGVATPTDGDPNDNIVAEGDIDLSTLSISQVDIPALPEPGTWALMIFGFGIVGCSRRRSARRGRGERPAASTSTSLFCS